MRKYLNCFLLKHFISIIFQPCLVFSISYDVLRVRSVKGGANLKAEKKGDSVKRGDHRYKGGTGHPG